MNEETVTLLIPITYFGLMLLERIAIARALPKVNAWYSKGIIGFLLMGVVSALTPAWVASLYGAGPSLGLDALGAWGGGVVVIVTTEGLLYLLHRTLHVSDLGWRFLHQLHHGAERFDIPSSTFIHPGELMIAGALSTLVVLALGVTPEAAGLAGFFNVFNAFFQHANIRTPRWLGYFIQRPEAHSLHHARGIHAYNYASLTLVDMLFGTFRNPEDFHEEQGFWDGASSEIGSMLLGRDVAEARSRASVDGSWFRPERLPRGSSWAQALAKACKAWKEGRLRRAEDRSAPGDDGGERVEDPGTSEESRLFGRRVS